jgi:phenylacetate-CoA ligase
MSFEDKFHWLLARYIASPQWLKNTVGWAYAALPMRVRVGASYARWCELAQMREADHAAQLDHLVRDKLQQTLLCALAHVPAWRQYAPLLQSLGDTDPWRLLRQLPLLSKEMIKQDLDAYLADNRPKRHRMKMFTGGSTATPMQFYIEQGVTRVKEYAFIEEFHSRVGLTQNDVVLALRGRSVPDAQSGRRFWMYEPIKRQLILSSDHLLAANMPDYMAALRAWQPTYIQAFPSALYPLAKWLDQHPQPDITARIRGVMLFSENVYDHQYELFQKVFGCPVLKHYGHSERAVMAASTPGDKRYFVYPQYGFVELIDFEGRAVTEAGVLGQIVATGFDNQVMPFVRYQTGDLAVLSEAIDPERPWRVVFERVEGRLQEFVVTIDRRLISIATLGAAHFNELAEVGAIQYEQSEPGKIDLWVEVQGKLHDAMKQSIAHAVREKTQGGCELRVRETPVIKRSVRGKHQMLLQHLDLVEYQSIQQNPQAR